jgi:hypothetical protein
MGGFPIAESFLLHDWCVSAQIEEKWADDAGTR